MSNWQRRTLRAGLGVGVALAVLAGLALVGRWQQHRIGYHPARGPLPEVADVLPGAREVEVITDDGLTLTHWLVPPAQGVDDRQTAVMFAHGNGGNLAHRAPLARELAHQGFTVMLVGYRGFADNPGTPSQEGLVHDAHSALRALEEEGFDAAHTIFLGESIGTGVVVALAAELDEPPAGLVLRSPFTSLWDVGATMIPIPPLVRFIMSANEYPLAAQLAGIDAAIRVTVLHGTADEVVPSSQSVRVAEIAATRGMLLEEIAIEGARHNDTLWMGPTVADAVARLADAIAPD